MRVTALFQSKQQAQEAASELRQQGAGTVNLSVLGTAEPLNGADPRIGILEREERGAGGDGSPLHSVGWPREATHLPDGPHHVGAVLVAFETEGVNEAALEAALTRNGGQIHRGVSGQG